MKKKISRFLASMCSLAMIIIIVYLDAPALFLIAYIFLSVGIYTFASLENKYQYEERYWELEKMCNRSVELWCKEKEKNERYKLIGKKMGDYLID